jgi:hypothetical protein
MPLRAGPIVCTDMSVGGSRSINDAVPIDITPGMQ